MAASKKSAAVLIPTERIERSILLIRGHKVVLDADLAELYGVETGALVRAVKRNIERFPSHFMFQLTQEEWDEALRCQIGISKREGRGGRRYAPYAFTEHGSLQAANVLKSKRAAQVSIQVIDTFIRLRQMLASDRALARRLDALEKKYDAQFKAVFKVIRQLMEGRLPPKSKKNGDDGGIVH